MAEMRNRRQSGAKEGNEITFKCRYCGKTSSLDKMRFLSRFFPPIVVCPDCEKKMQSTSSR